MLQPCLTTFLDKPTDPEGVDYILFGAPLDKTSSNRKGSRFGPGAVRRESTYLDTYSQRAKLDWDDLNLADIGDIECPNVGSCLESIEDVIDKVNGTQYGLQAGVFTHDLSTAMACAEGIDAGGVLINEIPTFRVDNMPYGGTKGSGIGREGPEFAVKDMTEEKLVVFDRLP